MTSVRIGLSGSRASTVVPDRLTNPSPGAARLREFFSANSSLPPALAREGLSLAAETDPQLLAEGVLGLAGRLECSESPGDPFLAYQLYRWVAEGDTSSRGRARARAEAMAGLGAFGIRAERSLRTFARQAADPALILGLGVASGVFALTRTATLSRLVSAPTASWLTRGFGARALAATAGFALEAPSFTLATRLGHEALGRNQDWSRTALAREFASGYLALGGLRLAGWASGAGYSRIAGPVGAVRERPLQTLFQQTGMMGGILLGHGLERWAGLRPAQDGATLLFDSLSLLLQFHVAGRLSSGILGRPYAALESALDHHSRNAPPDAAEISQDMGRGLENFLGPRLAPVTATSPWRVRPDSSRPVFPPILAMSALRPEVPGTPEPGRLEARFDQLVRPNFHEKSVSPPPRNGKHPRPAIRRLGILTSGGDGPGENAAIEALVRGAIQAYGWEPVGIFDGYLGLLQPEGRIRELTLADVSGEGAVRDAVQRLYGGKIPPGFGGPHSEISTLGGDILRSSRTNPVQGDPEALRVKQTMREHGLDALVVLGGNGSMRAAEALRRAGVPVVGIPQSIDLDVWGSEHSIGFPSAVAKGASEMHHFSNTAQSCHRWFLVEVMGQHYGMLTLAVGRESRVADSVFIEVPRPLSEARDIIERRRPDRTHGVLLFSEGVKFRGEGVSVIEPPRGTDVHGRLVVESGDVVRWLRGPLAELGISHTRPESLGYLLRGADPTPEEIALARVLSEGALRLVEAGRFGRMVGTAFAQNSSALHLVYPRLSRVATRQKPPPEENFRYVRDLLENP